MVEEGAYIKNDRYLLLKEEEIKKVKVELVYTEDVTNRLGYVIVSLYNKELFKEDVFLKDEDNNKSFFEKIFDLFYKLKF